MRVITESYAQAIRNTMIFALATVGLAFIVTLGIENRNIKSSKKKAEITQSSEKLDAET